jgi:hypothetical protein
LPPLLLVDWHASSYIQYCTARNLVVGYNTGTILSFPICYIPNFLCYTMYRTLIRSSRRLSTKIVHLPLLTSCRPTSSHTQSAHLAQVSRIALPTRAAFHSTALSTQKHQKANPVVKPTASKPTSPTETPTPETQDAEVSDPAPPAQVETEMESSDAREQKAAARMAQLEEELPTFVKDRPLLKKL